MRKTLKIRSEPLRSKKAREVKLRRLRRPSVLGFALITTQPGEERKVYQQLKKIHEVIEIYQPIHGEFNLLAKLQTPNYEEMGSLADLMTKISGVSDVKMLPALSTVAKRETR